MEIWKRNLIVCWFGMFVTSVGMSQIAPILPLYIRTLGVTDASMVAQYSGIAFGITYIVSAIFSPIWGHAADLYGRKPMLLRASFGMAVTVGAMGFASDVSMLIGLRFLMGAVAGYTTACTTLIATQTDKEHAGYALGTLSTSSIAGSLLGPVIGGFIGERWGFQSIFFLTGGLMFIVFFTTTFFVREHFIRQEGKAQKARDIWKSVPQKSLTVTMFATFFILMLALCSVEPVITIYVSQLSQDPAHVALIAGLVFSASGLANMIAAPPLGRLSDKIGAHKVILVALLLAGVVFIPQAFVSDPWQLMALRFVLGLASAGLNPSVNTIIKRITPDEITGRIFGFNMSAAYLGVFGGAVMGGQIAAYLGVKYVFLVTSALLLANAALVYYKVYKKFEPA
ncbi:MAG TPA: multidrug efflux MFS transporter [Bacteroidota bacterium]|nr:multidrug efflux MFS transporter [Bacteroidota bacterium]